MPKIALALILLLACVPTQVAHGAADDDSPRLLGRAVLPADTFAPGPPSGTQLATAPINGRTPPFASQPVQGFSAVLTNGSEYLAMPDNGFGAKANSADFLLRITASSPTSRPLAAAAARSASASSSRCAIPTARSPSTSSAATRASGC